MAIHDQVRPYNMNRIITDILHYDISDLLDDYIHCQKHHKYNQIYNLLQSTPEYLCPIKSCSFLKRNYRNRQAMVASDHINQHHNNEMSHRIKLYLCVSDSLNVATMQILDKIHCYLTHSFINQPRLDRDLRKQKSFGKLTELDIINVNDLRFNEIEPDFVINPQQLVKLNHI